MKNLIFILISLFIFSCSENLKQGKVIEKWYEPEKTVMQMIPITHQIGKNIYTTYMQIPIRQPEKYCISVKGIGERGDTLIKTFTIDKTIYDTISIGLFVHIENK